MASIFDSFNYGGHGVAESTMLLATTSGGHFFNLVSTEDVDNGSVAKFPTPETWAGNDYFTAVKPGVKDKVVLVLTAPKIYAEYTKKMQEEDNFYNAKGELMRSYELYAGDRFSLNDAAFDGDATPKKDAYVVVKAGSHKLTTIVVAGSVTAPAAADYGFIGRILKVNANGTYDIMVKQNENV